MYRTLSQLMQDMCALAWKCSSAFRCHLVSRLHHFFIVPALFKSGQNLWKDRKTCEFGEGQIQRLGKLWRFIFRNAGELEKATWKFLKTQARIGRSANQNPLSTQNGRVRIAEAGVSFQSKEWTSQVFFLRLSTSRLAAHQHICNIFLVARSTSWFADRISKLVVGTQIH